MRQRSVASPIRCAPEAGAWQLIVSRKAVLLFKERLRLMVRLIVPNGDRNGERAPRGGAAGYRVPTPLSLWEA